MMITPEMYWEMYVEGESEEGKTRAINKLKKDIEGLQKKVDYNEPCFIEPDFSVQLKCSKEYLRYIEYRINWAHLQGKIINKEQEIIDFWSERIPQLKNRLIKYLQEIKSMDEENGFYRAEINRIYSLIIGPIVDYFYNAMAFKNKENLILFFKSCIEFYDIYKNKFISEENIPRDLILDIFYAYIFEGIGEDDEEMVKKLMPEFLKEIYNKWLNNF